MDKKQVTGAPLSGRAGHEQSQQTVSAVPVAIPSAEDTIPGYSDLLSNIADLMRDIPLPPIFASAAIFPTDHAWSFTHERQDYLLANRAFWDKIPVAAPKAAPLLSDVPIIDLDAPRNSMMQGKVYDALAQAMSAGTAETQSGSGRQPASAVAESHAPETTRSQGNNDE